MSVITDFFSPEEIAAIRSYYSREVPPAQRLTDEELERGLLVAAQRRLKPPPIANHLYFLKRAAREQGADGQWSSVAKLSIQTGIDGLRLGAERTGKYLGSSVPQHEHDAGGFLQRTTMTIYKLGPDGHRVEVGAEAWFNEYAQWYGSGEKRRLTKMWEEKPHLMCAKCCEALGIRKALPEEFSGIYTVEEMGRAEDLADDLPAPQSRAAKSTQACEGGKHAWVRPAGGAPWECQRCGLVSENNPMTGRPANLPASSGGPAVSPTTSAPPPPVTPSAPPPDRASSAAAPTSATTAPPRAAPAAPAAGPASTAPSAAPAAQEFADPERRGTFLKVLGNSCFAYGVKPDVMVGLLRKWAPRPDGTQPIVSDACKFAADMTADELERIIAEFKKWEQATREFLKGAAPPPKPDAPPEPSPEEVAERAAEAWEAQAAAVEAGEPPFRADGAK